MQLGFMTVRDMRALPFEEVARWGSEQGFAAVDATLETIDVCARYGIAVGSIPLGANVLTTDAHARGQAQKQAMQTIEAAAAKGVRRIMIDHRRMPGMSAEESLDVFAKGYAPVAEFAEGHDVKLVMEIYHAHGQWLAITPELIRAVLAAVPSRSLGICLDPSHLVVQGIDYLRATREFGERIYYSHAKDTEILSDKLYEYGIMGRALGPNVRPYGGWWRYRLPGYGQINWAQFISALVEVGYDEVLAIEHEDAIWYGSPELNRRGLLLAKAFLDPYMG
ncbi:MAG: TIM barrel protein [Anaerolineae bacterium]|nr:TIM barrel protein [Anaerolineae bacterium]